jgi:translation elongation factor EF-1alpha
VAATYSAFDSFALDQRQRAERGLERNELFLPSLRVVLSGAAPSHLSFAKNVLSAAGRVDGVLFVVSAGECDALREARLRTEALLLRLLNVRGIVVR